MSKLKFTQVKQEIEIICSDCGGTITTCLDCGKDLKGLDTYCARSSDLVIQGHYCGWCRAEYVEEE